MLEFGLLWLYGCLLVVLDVYGGGCSICHICNVVNCSDDLLFVGV